MAWVCCEDHRIIPDFNRQKYGKSPDLAPLKLRIIPNSICYSIDLLYIRRYTLLKRYAIQKIRITSGRISTERAS